MKENICTIPINDIFKDTNGCPICRMYKMLEEQYVEFITGSAMMAPDVRVQTNKVGFCNKHLMMMNEKGPKLANTLLLQTHIDEIQNNILPKTGEPNKKQLEELRFLKTSCYVCDRIDKDIMHLLKTVFVQFSTDEEFRKLYKSQEYICLEHYELLIREGSSKNGVDKKFRKEFVECTNKLTKQYANTLVNNLTTLSTMYDYRNQGKDFSNVTNSIEKSIEFLP